MEPMAVHPGRPSVVAVVGSPRAAGNTSYLVDVALDELVRAGLAVEKIMLSEFRVLPCEGHDDCEDLPVCPLDDDAGAILERMYAADGLILATPVYYEDVSGQMKVFIDRNCFNNYHEVWLQARSVGLIAVAESTGVDETVDSLRRFVALSSDKKVKPLSVTGLAYRAGDAAGNGPLIAAVRDMARAMAIGADWCNSARGFMFALGCIQSLSCHTDRCPTGVTTQDPTRNRALVVPHKIERVYNYHHATLHALAELLAAAGLEHPQQLRPIHFSQRTSTTEVRSFATLYPTLRPGELIDGTSDSRYREAWAMARADSFQPAS